MPYKSKYLRLTVFNIMLFFLLCCSFTTFYSCAKDEDIFNEVFSEENLNENETINDFLDLTNNKASINEDTELTITIADVLKSSKQSIGDLKSAKLITNENGTNGKVTTINDTLLKYIPNSDFEGLDSFTYGIEIVNSQDEIETTETSIEVAVRPIKDAENDVFEITSNEVSNVAPLANDSFTKIDNLRITNVSASDYASFDIQDDNTISITPVSNYEGDIIVIYTVALNFEGGTTSQEVAEILLEVSNDSGKSTALNSDVAYWKELFDEQWNGDSQDAFSKSSSGNYNQEYYYLAYYIDGLTSIWQATGDNSYLDTALDLINNTIDDAQPMNGFYGWPSNPQHGSSTGYGLWDSFMWRFVTNLLNVMHKSPNLLTNGYQANFDKILAFSEENIWERYEARGVGNFYRINTHMTSHWARISMDLFLITGNEKYKNVFDRISYGPMVGRPSSLRGQIEQNSNGSYIWYSDWERKASIQDTSHAGAIVSFWVSAYENGQYWNRQDIEGLISTLKNLIWDEDSERFSKNVDGSGGNDLYGRLHEWLHLGRYDSEVQNKIKDYYTGRNLDYYGSHAAGIASLNAKILTDGKPAYPEQ